MHAVWFVLYFLHCRTGGWCVTLKEISSLMALSDLEEAGISALEGMTMSCFIARSFRGDVIFRLPAEL